MHLKSYLEKPTKLFGQGETSRKRTHINCITNVLMVFFYFNFIFFDGLFLNLRLVWDQYLILKILIFFLNSPKILFILFKGFLKKLTSKTYNLAHFTKKRHSKFSQKINKQINFLKLIQ